MPKGQLGSNRHFKSVSTASEKELSKKVGGRRVRGSGCSQTHKGDIKTDYFLFEVKETGNKAFLLDQTVLCKICKESREAGRRPAVILKFHRTPLGTPKDWVIIPLSELQNVGII